MAWVAPPTFTSGNVLTAAQMNILSGDLLETAPAKATAGGQFFVSTGVGAVVPRTPQWGQVNTAETTNTLATFGDLATVGPSVTATVSASCVIAFGARIQTNTGGGGGEMSWEGSGATTLPAPNGHTLLIRDGIANQASQCSKINWQVTINAGSNTFTAKYTTPTGGIATFSFRDILVLPF